MRGTARLIIGADRYIILQQIPASEWYQVTESIRCQHITDAGDMVRSTKRGWEFFSSLEDNSPRYVLPSRAAILDRQGYGEEE
tara:strand:- start:1837 stop:2085 length:249 start_codon:yes stop_codon:yes gene_type:complete